MPKDGSSADGSGGSQGQTGPRNKASANIDKTKFNAEKGLEEVALEQSWVPGEKAETKAEAGTSSQQPPNQMI
jgi:hypothetical protein